MTNYDSTLHSHGFSSQTLGDANSWSVSPLAFCQIVTWMMHLAVCDASNVSDDVFNLFVAYLKSIYIFIFQYLEQIL